MNSVDHSGRETIVGRRIRELRRERSLTQSELAARIGIQQSDLSRMERGRYRVSLDALFRLLAEFDMSVGEFFEDRRRGVNAREARLLRDLAVLDSEAQREVEDFISFKRTQAQARRRACPDPGKAI